MGKQSTVPQLMGPSCMLTAAASPFCRRCRSLCRGQHTSAIVLLFCILYPCS